ncbi:putative c2 domain-containing protein [Zalerion maritima]|uniref:C2 domain-containing protein n=1 Tax=Zalerion maritima TaxID=339359 RepID=A0AAD5RYE8_9PEZI|nr:putative c2 domain-containing protein [Zalerion maritima]
MATEQYAAELKQQGALEASRDPESSVTAGDAEKKLVEESKNAGVPAFNFDPDASLAEKKAQAAAAIPPGLRNKNKFRGEAIITDTDGGAKAEYDLPEASKDGVVATPTSPTGQSMPGSFDADDYSKTGWAPQFGWPNDPIHESESMLDHTTWLESRVPDQYYGDWYHNAAVIVFACLASWIVAVFGGGLGWVFIVMATCGTYYRTSIRRVRRNFRDDINREMALKRLETDTESLEWINSFMVKFWPIYQPILAQTVINSVDQVLSSATPAFLDSLKLKTFTLGSKPPRMEHVKTYPKMEDDTVVMDWKFSFTPTDTADMTSRQIKNKINPKVVLEIRIGKAMISKGLDVIVENMAFSGIMRLKIKLQIPFPHVEKVEMCFLERPAIDYVCKPLGGETFGFDINFIPGLESFILEQIHGNLAPMMYAPNVFPIEVAKMLAGTPVDQAVGVVAVTLHGAQGLKNSDSFAGSVDPYAILTLNRRKALAQTKVVKDTANPRWNETHYIIITSFNDSLDIQVFDYNDIRKDKELGVASFALENIEDNNIYENENIEVVSDGKARGMLSCDIRFFPVLEENTLSDGKVEPPPETNTGILRFTVEQAKDLDGTKSLIGLLNPYACLLLNGKEIHQTKALKRTNNPIWDNGSKEILITDRKHAKLGVAVKDDRDLAADQMLGTYQIKLDDMIEMMDKGKDWFNLHGAKTGRAKMRAQWKPVAISGVLASTGGYVTPIGVMRFHFKCARDLRNFESLGKSDPYVRVMLSGIEKARTVTFRNTLDPEWDEVLYVPVHSSRERLVLDVMDQEKMGKDRSLGSIEMPTSDFVAKDDNEEYLVNDSKVVREQGLRLHGKGIEKGVLIYTTAFYPCLNIADEDEEAEEAEEDSGLLSPTSTQEPTTPTSPKTPVSTSSDSDAEEKEPKGPAKLHLTPQELLRHESGLLIFKLMEAEMPRGDTHLEVYVDDMAFPSYISSVAKEKRHKFSEIGDCFIRELDWSRLTLKVREKGERQGDSDKDKTLARLQGNTLDTLKQCLNNPTVLKMKDDDGKISTVKISLKYLPVKMQLDPSESINNMGSLRVDLIDAEGLPAADSNGKSDPYAKFDLNDQEVFKSKTQKKTLNPVWNEYFDVAVNSRTGSTFVVKVFDYDFADKPDFLGSAEIDLKPLEPFRASDMKLPLIGKKGQPTGKIHIRCLFRSDYVQRTRQGTGTFGGTFSAPTRIMTSIGGAPKNVVKGGTSFFKKFGGKRDESPNSSTSDLPTIPTINTSAPTANGGDSGSAGGGISVPGIGGLKKASGLGIGAIGGSSSKEAAGNGTGNVTPPTYPPSAANGGHSRQKSVSAASMHSVVHSGATSGTANFTVVAAKGFPPPSDVYVVLVQTTPKEKTVGKTKHHKSPNGVVKYDQTFKCPCSPDSSFEILVKGEHTFGSDDDLGKALYFIDETGSNAEKEVKVGSGIVIMKSHFVPNDSGHGSLADSPRSIRKSFLGIRETRSREGTPNT